LPTMEKSKERQRDRRKKNIRKDGERGRQQ
jgi:hypothetical protein